MALPAPRLDDRHFQDIVDEAKKRIPHYCEEWTDHNVSDPGVTLIELFAWMTDMILYRLNQVPDRHYIKFMEMLGIRLREPVPARAPVTFWLSAPQETKALIPAGTEVASTQTENEASIVFTTDENFIVHPADLTAVITRVATREPGKKQYNTHNLRRLASGFEGFEIYSRVPQIDDALYFGFKEDMSHHLIGLDLDYDQAGGAGIDPTLPPYTWEASSAQKGIRWEPCELEMDTTKGMNSAGRIMLHLPRMAKLSVNEENYYWIRARVKDITPREETEGMAPYQVSPTLRKVALYSSGGTIMITHRQQAKDEFLGRSDGSAGQRFYLQSTPLLDRKPGEQLLVHVEGRGREIWQEVRDFAESRSTDNHYMLDSATGEIRFGPAIRQPDGTIKLYGNIPPRGANLIFERYSFGGGQDGNVQRGVINTLKTAIPYISRVSNRRPAWGGMDAESLESAMMRAPLLLRSRDRAVTESDFEFLAMQALPASIGRVKCLQPRPADEGRVVPGQIYVLVVPKVPRPSDYLDPNQLELKKDDMDLLSAFMDERRLLTTRVSVREPAYTWVAVKAMLRPAPGADPRALENEILRRLYAFLNPLTGGTDGKGWPFGRDLFVSDVYQCLQGTPNVQFIRGVEMYAAQPGGAAAGKPLEQIDIVAHGVVASGLHVVEFV
ncbi:MAG: putative baseplate assembly protein [Anaerolineales bacterium]|nr:putative baseplate assembly protein [Anaerolineales bacterium]